MAENGNHTLGGDEGGERYLTQSRDVFRRDHWGTTLSRERNKYGGVWTVRKGKKRRKL